MQLISDIVYNKIITKQILPAAIIHFTLIQTVLSIKDCKNWAVYILV